MNAMCMKGDVGWSVVCWVFWRRWLLWRRLYC